METQKLSFKDRYNQKIKEYLEVEKVIELESSKAAVVCDLNKEMPINEGKRSLTIGLPGNSGTFKMKLFLFKLILERCDHSNLDKN
jgi:hypothetical protein